MGRFLCVNAYFGASIHLILFFLFQMMVNKKHGKQKKKKVWNLQKAFSLRTIKICQFEIIDGVKYVCCLRLQNTLTIFF